MKRNRIIFVIIILIIIGVGLIYYFPLQRAMAIMKFDRYIRQLEIDKNDIEEKRVFKDYKQGGYFIDVKYKSEPDYTYSYHYFLLNFRNDGIFFNQMYVEIYDSEGGLVKYYEIE